MTEDPLASRLLRLSRLFDTPPDATFSGDPSLEVARYLGLDLSRRLRAVAVPDASPELLIEGARVCGDLATLIACNPALLQPDEALRATQNAAAATQEILVLMQDGLASSEGERAGYLIRDVRGAIWRADLAVRQMEEVAKRATSEHP